MIDELTLHHIKSLLDKSHLHDVYTEYRIYFPGTSKCKTLVKKVTKQKNKECYFYAIFFCSFRLNPIPFINSEY